MLVPTMNTITSALRFFTQVLDRPDLARRLVRITQMPRRCRIQTRHQSFFEGVKALNATVEEVFLMPLTMCSFLLTK